MGEQGGEDGRSRERGEVGRVKGREGELGWEGKGEREGGGVGRARGRGREE